MPVFPLYMQKNHASKNRRCGLKKPRRFSSFPQSKEQKQITKNKHQEKLQKLAWYLKCYIIRLNFDTLFAYTEILIRCLKVKQICEAKLKIK